MTTKTTEQAARAIGVADVADANGTGEGLARFPDFPPRDDMQNTKYIYSQSTITALMNYLGDPDTTYVGSEIPLGWTASVRRGVLVPDLMVARNCDVDRVNAQDGYEMRSQPGPPEFVLEVASVSTATRDEDAKRTGYANYGVHEYWRFDTTDGRRYRAGLEGDRLVGGAYMPIELERYGANSKRGYSEVLGLYLCWEGGYLRLYDPVSESYLRTHEESEARAAEADAEAARADRADARAADAESARAEAEARAAEAEAQAAAEAEARRQADALVRELRERLAQEGGGG